MPSPARISEGQRAQQVVRACRSRATRSGRTRGRDHLSPFHEGACNKEFPTRAQSSGFPPLRPKGRQAKKELFAHTVAGQCRSLTGFLLRIGKAAARG
jgi:hypothetical protein